MSIASELSRKQNYWQADTWICLQKSTKSTTIADKLDLLAIFIISRRLKPGGKRYEITTWVAKRTVLL